MSKILMVASETTPYAKTGGLADVLGALPAALAARGEEVAVVLPLYRSVVLSQAQEVWHHLPVWLGIDHYDTQIVATIDRGVQYFFVNCPPLYDRAGLYSEDGLDYPDNAIRFAVLSKAALGVARYLFRPHVIHCHDWQAALVAPYLRHFPISGYDPTFLGVKLLTTIHNLGYQGRFGPETAAEVGLDRSAFHPGIMEFFGDLNLLKGAIVYSDAISTVSPAYALEIQTPEHGFGLDDLLRAHRNVLSGILNGVDYAEWNPETDRYIAAHYSAGDLSGKQVCKRRLLQQFGLPAEKLDWPVIGIVSRFATQKGFDLIAEIAPELAAEKLLLTVLGSGQPEYEEMFRTLAAAFPNRIGLHIGYDEALAHQVEAGADMFLMPSRYEPSGLNQMYSLRYGTIPIVRATGGLDDTIEEGVGFKFQDYSGAALLGAIRAALAVYQTDPWPAMMRRAMRKDFSWNASAAEYSLLYKGLTLGLNPQGLLKHQLNGD